MVINNNSVNRIIPPVKRNIRPDVKRSVDKSSSFDSVLKEKMSADTGLKFSKHAQARLGMRDISLSMDQRHRMSQAVDKAEKKGVRDSLILVDDMVFLVNIKNKTVVTAVNNSELKENVF